MGLPPPEQAKKGLSGTGDTPSPEASAVEWFSQGKKQKMEQTRKETVYLQRLADRREGPRPPWPALSHQRVQSASACPSSCPATRGTVLVGTREEVPATQTFMKLGREWSEGLE